MSAARLVLLARKAVPAVKVQLVLSALKVKLVLLERMDQRANAVRLG